MRRISFFIPAILLSLLPVSSFAAPFTVVTYNIGLLRVLGFDLVPAVEARIKAAPHVISTLAADLKPQIMLLEEVWEDSAADAITRELTPLGYAAIKPAVHSILGLSSGLLLLVKPPMRVIDWKFTPYARNTFTDSFARKGVLDATLEDTVTGTRFVLIGTHTVAIDTNNGQPKDKGQLRVIMAQTGQILSTLVSRSDNGRLPALLMGDFNVGPGYADAVYRIIADYSGVRESGEVLFPTAPVITWDPDNPLVKYGSYPTEPPAKIDHIFMRNGSGAQWTPREAWVAMIDPVPGLAITPTGAAAPVPMPLSDHYAFVVQVDLTK